MTIQANAYQQWNRMMDAYRALKEEPTISVAETPVVYVPLVIQRDPVAELFLKIAKKEKHIEYLNSKLDSCGAGKAARAKKATLTPHLKAHQTQLSQFKGRLRNYSP